MRGYILNRSDKKHLTQAMSDITMCVIYKMTLKGSHKYEKGMSIMEIVSNSEISRRTAYRYKAYYDEMKNAKTN